MLIINNSIVIAHMKKCGGTSVCKGMAESLPAGTADYWGYTPEGEQKSAESRRGGGVWKHSTVAEIVDKLPHQRQSLTIYLVSLRPWWDRVGSFYFHARKYNRRFPKKYTWVKDMSFSKYIRSEYISEVEHLDRFSQDANGANLVDYFVPYDGLATWYQEILQKQGVEGAVLPGYNRGREKFSDGYMELYNDADFSYLQQEFAGETALCDSLQPAGNVLSLP